MKEVAPRLNVQDLCVGYDREVDVLKNVSISVGSGQIVGVIGANGAGKSTLLRTVTGYLNPRQGQVVFDGEEITGQRPDLLCGRGIGYLMEGHTIFPRMNVEENLLLGAWPFRRQSRQVAEALERAYKRVPWLKERRAANAGLLSGGQQRILEIERLCMTSPSLILLDEPSLGLAPKLAEHVFTRAVAFKHDGTSVVLIDQNIRRVIEISDYVYVIKLGEVQREGAAHVLADDIGDIVRDMI